MTKSVFVSVVGEPNVGKSSIVNMLLGKKVSIVAPKPQTTRNRINAVMTDNDFQIVFSDLPGFLTPRTSLDYFIKREIESNLCGSDLILCVFEAGRGFSQRSKAYFENIKKYGVPVVFVLNKIDKIKNKSLLLGQINSIVENFKISDIIPVSAKTSYGRLDLLECVKRFGKESVFYYPAEKVTDQTDEGIVREIIREKVLRFINQEIPHGVGVYVEHIKKRNSGILDISCVVYCEKSTHKGIIIGKNGAMLKKIGTAARFDIKEFFNAKVNLNLWVKVKEDWRNRENILKELGYSEF